MYANHIWAADITYVWIYGNVLYLHLITDVYSHAVIGWCLSETMEAIVKPKPCSFPKNRQPPMAGQAMAIRSMYPMCFGIIPAGDCLPDFLEMGRS